MTKADIVQRGWDAIAVEDFDTLVGDYVDDLSFIMPGQNDVLEGKQAFRSALDGLSQLFPPGFEIIGLRQIEQDGEVVSIIEWKSGRIASSQLAVLFRFRGDKIYEERWFVDTEQWKGAF